MKAIRASGWGIPGRVGIDTKNVYVNVGDVCTCSWRRSHCEKGKRCVLLGSDGGESGETLILRRLMGKKFPKVWGEGLLWKNMKQLCARSDKLEEFRREFFGKCRKLTVEVRGR